MWLKQTPIQENICIWRTKLIFKLKRVGLNYQKAASGVPR